MAHYLKTSDGISIASGSALEVSTVLPGGTYRVLFSMNAPHRLVPVDDFSVPKKLYGDTEVRASKILKAFEIQDRSTGVLLIGAKGSGKSVLARCLGRELLKQSVPTIIVPYNQIGDALVPFLDGIDTPCMILFDEIDKIADVDDTDTLLGLFDGVSGTKKLFVLTANRESRINEAFLNRPGRILYRYVYGGLSEDVIREYCHENGMRHEHIEMVVSISAHIRDFSFDIMRAIVFECAAFGITPIAAMEHLNVTPSMSGYFRATVTDESGYEFTVASPEKECDFDDRYERDCCITAAGLNNLEKGCLEALEAKYPIHKNDWIDDYDSFRGIRREAHEWYEENNITETDADAAFVDISLKLPSYDRMEGPSLVYDIENEGHNYTVRLTPCASPYSRIAYRF